MATAKNAAASSSDHCHRCQKRVYVAERLGPIKDSYYHKLCFKCSTCDQQLNLKSYCTNAIDLKDTAVYCRNHAPRLEKSTFSTDSLQIQNALKLQKLFDQGPDKVSASHGYSGFRPIMPIEESDSVLTKEDYLILLRNKIDHYTTELMTQSSSFCPSTLSSLEIIDKRLKELVRLHHLDLLRTINYQICELNSNIHIKKLSKQLSSFRLTTKQDEIINRLITIRKKQLKIFQDLAMFEQRILCHKLPNSFDCIKVDNNEKLCVNKRNKIIQDSKRRMLNVKLEQYEIKIQYYEYLYEQELTVFKSETFRTNSSYQMHKLDMLMYSIKTYLYHHTNILIRQIGYKESRLHAKLLRHDRRQSFVRKKIIAVYPQIIVDVPRVSLNRIQLDYLSHTRPNYIRPNQNSLHSYEHRQKQMKEEHKNIMNTASPYLVHVYHMSNTSTIIKQFSQQLETCLHQRYMAPLSYLSTYRARKELKLIN